jgi:hypothetical protein
MIVWMSAGVRMVKTVRIMKCRGSQTRARRYPQYPSSEVPSPILRHAISALLLSASPALMLSGKDGGSERWGIGG